MSTEPKITGQTSDGYHTFDELYEHRHALFLFAMSCNPNSSWFSPYHDDGTSFQGWFVAGIGLPSGPVTYHLPGRLIEVAYLTGAKLLPKAPPFDGHTSADVIVRLMKAAKVSPIVKASIGEDPKDDAPKKDTMSTADQIVANKQARKDGDAIIQNLKALPPSRERSLAITKLQEGVMWLGMDLKRINEEQPGASPNPYPESKDPGSLKIEPTADGLKL